jgi:hypothetical protein
MSAICTNIAIFAPSISFEWVNFAEIITQK